MDLWARLHPNHPAPRSVPTEYPKWVDGKLVHSREEETRAEVGEEVEAPEPNRLFTPQPEITEKSRLQLEAQSLGIGVDRRWGEKKLRKMIEGHR